MSEVFPTSLPASNVRATLRSSVGNRYTGVEGDPTGIVVGGDVTGGSVGGMVGAMVDGTVVAADVDGSGVLVELVVAGRVDLLELVVDAVDDGASVDAVGTTDG